MKAWAWVFGFLAGITAILACVPPTSWAIKNELDVFRGKLRREDTDAYPAAYNLQRASVPQDGSFERKLVSELWSESSDHPEHVLEIVRQQRGTAFALAIAIRSLLGHASLPTPPYSDGEGVYPVKVEDRDVYALKQQRFGNAVEAARKGEALDPTNAFFPLCQAVAYYGMGMKSQTDDALRRAAACPVFNSYCLRQADLQECVGLSIHGYRGTLYRMTERYTPEFYLMRSAASLGGWLSRDQAPNADRVLIDYLKIVRQIYLTSKDLDDYQMAGGAIASLFRPPYSILVDDKAVKETQEVAAARLFVDRLSTEDRKVVDFDLPALVSGIRASERRLFAKRQALTEYRWYENWDAGEVTTMAFNILIGMALVGLIALMAWGMSKMPEKADLGAAGPLLATGAYGLIDSILVENMSDSQFIRPLAFIHLGLGVLALFERSRRLAYVLGFAAPVVAILLHLSDVLRRGDGPFEAIPLGVLILFVSRDGWLKWRGLPKRMSLIVLGVTLMTGWYIAFSVAADNGFFAWKYMMTLLILVAILSVTWQGGSFRRTGEQWLRSVPSLGLIVWTFYLLAVFFDVHEDNRIGSSVASFENMPTAIREAAPLTTQNPIVVPYAP